MIVQVQPRRSKAVLVCLMLSLLSACVVAPAPILPSLANRTVMVLPANNRTGDELLISGGSILEKYAWHGDRVTVADVLSADAEQELAQRGIAVVPEPADLPIDLPSALAFASSHHLADTVLAIDIRRWEADAGFHPGSVIVGLDVSLVDAATGRILWTGSHPSRPIPTPGAVSAADAYDIAARAVIAQFLAPFGAAR